MLYEPYDIEARFDPDYVRPVYEEELSLEAIAESELEIQAIRKLGTRVHLDAYELADDQTSDDPEYLADVGSGMAMDFGPLTLSTVRNQIVRERYEDFANVAPEVMA